MTLNIVTAITLNAPKYIEFLPHFKLPTFSSIGTPNHWMLFLCFKHMGRKWSAVIRREDTVFAVHFHHASKGTEAGSEGKIICTSGRVDRMHFHSDTMWEKQ